MIFWITRQEELVIVLELIEQYNQNNILNKLRFEIVFFFCDKPLQIIFSSAMRGNRAAFQYSSNTLWAQQLEERSNSKQIIITNTPTTTFVSSHFCSSPVDLKPIIDFPLLRIAASVPPSGATPSGVWLADCLCHRIRGVDFFCNWMSPSKTHSHISRRGCYCRRTSSSCSSSAAAPFASSPPSRACCPRHSPLRSFSSPTRLVSPSSIQFIA